MLRRSRQFVCSRLVWLFALSASSCSPTDSSDETTSTHGSRLGDRPGQICAQAMSGPPHCIPADTNPSKAWDMAAGSGPLPIKMWAPYTKPSADAMAEDPKALEEWLALNNKAIAYVRDVQKNAESYHATLGGPALALLKDVQTRQQQLIREREETAKNVGAKFEDALGRQVGPMTTEQVEDQAMLREIESDLERVNAVAVEFQSMFDRIASEFRQYRETESAVAVRWSDIANAASEADLKALAPLLVQAHDVSLAEGRYPNNIVLEATRLIAMLRQAADHRTLPFNEKRYREFIAKKGIKEPDFLSKPVRSLEKMIAYCERRRDANHEISRKIFDGIDARSQALVALQADAQTRETIARAKTARASAEFLDNVSERITKVGQSSEVSRKLKLPFLRPLYEQADDFVSFAPICAFPTEGWRQAGCLSFNRHFAGAQSKRDVIVPAILKAGLARLEADGADPRILADARKRLAAGDIFGAVNAHDEALRASDNL